MSQAEPIDLISPSSSPRSRKKIIASETYGASAFAISNAVQQQHPFKRQTQCGTRDNGLKQELPSLESQHSSDLSRSMSTKMRAKRGGARPVGTRQDSHLTQPRDQDSGRFARPTASRLLKNRNTTVLPSTKTNATPLTHSKPLSAATALNTVQALNDEPSEVQPNGLRQPLAASLSTAASFSDAAISANRGSGSCEQQMPDYVDVVARAAAHFRENQQLPDVVGSSLIQDTVSKPRASPKPPDTATDDLAKFATPDTSASSLREMFAQELDAYKMDHGYVTRSLLRAARESLSAQDNEHPNTFIDKKSPFGPPRSSKSTGSNKKVPSRFDCTEITYKSSAKDVPRHTYHVPLKCNIVAPGSSELKVLPVLDSGQRDIPDAMLDDLKAKYPRGIPDPRDSRVSDEEKHGVVRRELLKQQRPYILRFLNKIGCGSTIISLRDKDSIADIQDTLAGKASQAISEVWKAEYGDVGDMCPFVHEDVHMNTSAAQITYDHLQCDTCQLEIQDDEHTDGDCDGDKCISNSYHSTSKSSGGTQLHELITRLHLKTMTEEMLDYSACSSDCYIKPETNVLLSAGFSWSQDLTREFVVLLPQFCSDSGQMDLQDPCLLATAIMKPCYQLGISYKTSPYEKAKTQDLEDSATSTSSLVFDDAASVSPRGPLQSKDFLRFPGCRCGFKLLRCIDNLSCLCYKNKRECDTDLCSHCRTPEVAPSADEMSLRCGNQVIQNSRPKRTLLGSSAVGGFGLYMGEAAKKGEYIAEYVGELVSGSEAERRAVIYHENKAQYLMGLNKVQDLDATYMGNKTRFINNQSSEYNTNLVCQSMWCNGFIRRAFFATRDIKMGEELFFSYGYDEENSKTFIEKQLPPEHRAKEQELKKQGKQDQTKERSKKGKKMPRRSEIAAEPVLQAASPLKGADKRMASDSEGSVNLAERGDPGEFGDFAFVGPSDDSDGGTSGSVVAARLAEDPDVTVLVLEAGPDSANLENVHMPGGWSQNFDGETDWNIETVPTPGLGDRTVKTSRGRFLGGSSGCNGTLCIRGTKQDYNDWDMPGWSGDEVFRLMAKAETFHEKDWFAHDKEVHGYDGPLHVEPHDLAPISNMIMKSYEDCGMVYECDMFSTGCKSHACGHAPRTVHKGTRTTGADFLMAKGQRPSNVTIKCLTTVDNVVFSNNEGEEEPQAIGVNVLTKSGAKSIAYARREIIISGGAYCSPPVLLRSGIGPKEDLNRVGIPMKVDAPGVGRNLMDHLICFIFYETAEANLTNDYLVYHGDSFASTYQLWKNERKGFLSTFPFGAFAFARLDARLKDVPEWQDGLDKTGRDPMGLTPAQPNVEFFSTECYGGPKQYDSFPIDNQHAFAIIPELFAPKSRGTVRLASADPTANPIVDHNYLNDPLDMLVLSEACAFANEIITQGAGTKSITKGSWPPELTHHSYTKRQDWQAYVREHATTCYHPAGTCKMGKQGDPMAVVDAQLKVRGVKGLRVADTSVMPLLNQGHTQMPAYAIGEKAAEMIRAEASTMRVTVKS
ncbi:MAG: hypothetical protein M1828_001558 [Chrysothrix sp. TS-e1954]|nr:MAG: hypothetical protein M1828_001558 [Chrysothrix sp. TS-e1954]